MLTKVILEGPMGKKFGKEWELDVDSPNEALRMIDANKPGVFAWIKSNLEKYAEYHVVCEYEDGRVEDLNEQSYQLNRKCSVIRFIPVIKGSGGNGAFQTILGIVLIVAGVIFWGAGGGYLVTMGVAMLAGGIAQMLAPKPKPEKNERDTQNSTSYFFDGPVNTSTQGVPVQLIYGRCLVGSHTISAAVTVDQLK